MSPVGKKNIKAEKKEQTILCSKQLFKLIKTLQSQVENDLPGLLTELQIHASFLRRIKHQFRSSKIVQRSLSLQSCARRLQNLRGVRFRNYLVAPDQTFGQGVVALLNAIFNIGKLLVQVTSYTEFIAEASTQALAQEHYFFFGTDLSMLATTSRIWVMANAIYKSIGALWSKIRECFVNSGVEKRLVQKLPEIFPGAVEEPNFLPVTSEIALDENPTVNTESKSLGKSKKRKIKADTEENDATKEDYAFGQLSINQRPGKVSGALARFS